MATITLIVSELTTLNIPCQCLTIMATTTIIIFLFSRELFCDDVNDQQRTGEGGSFPDRPNRCEPASSGIPQLLRDAHERVRAIRAWRVSTTGYGHAGISSCATPRTCKEILFKSYCVHTLIDELET